MDGKVWGAGTPWKNSVAFFTYLRGGLRRVWSKHPSKLELIKEKRIQIPNPTGKGKATVWGFNCSVCNKTFAIKECQVDHIVAAGSLTRVEDIQGFVERLLVIGKEDLRLVCKLCNSTLAYSERSGMSVEDAIIEKQAILICKEPVKEVRKFISENGLAPASTAKGRRAQIVDILKGVKQ